MSHNTHDCYVSGKIDTPESANRIAAGLKKYIRSEWPTATDISVKYSNKTTTFSCRYVVDRVEYVSTHRIRN